MDIQLIIAFCALGIAILYLSRSIIGKQLASVFGKSDKKDQGCGPNCNCER